MEATAEQIRHSSSKQTPHLVNMRHCRRLHDHPSLRGSCLLGHWCQIVSAERPLSTTVLSEPHRQPDPATDTGRQHLRGPPPPRHRSCLPWACSALLAPGIPAQLCLSPQQQELALPRALHFCTDSLPENAAAAGPLLTSWKSLSVQNGPSHLQLDLR